MHKAVYTHIVTDANRDVATTDPFTMEIRRLNSVAPAYQGRRPVESRIMFHVDPVGTEGQPGYRRGFAFWNGDNEITVDGVTYLPGEVAGMSDYAIAMQSTEPITILLDGEDEQFRAWLVRGPSARNATVIYAIRVQGEDEWDTDIKYIGRVGQVAQDGVNFALQVDSEIYIPSQSGVTRMSDESQRSVFADDTIFRHLKTLAGGRREVWPG